MDISKRQLELIEGCLKTSLEHLDDQCPEPQGNTNEFVRRSIERSIGHPYNELTREGFESKDECISALSLVRKLLK